MYLHIFINISWKNLIIYKCFSINERIEFNTLSQNRAMYKTNTKRKKKPNCCRRILKEIWSYAKICIGISSIHGLNHLVSNKTIGER